MKSQKTVWSNEQQAIFDDFAVGTGNTVVMARAGTGKTTTICEAFAHFPGRSNRILYAVFNKRNQKEAEVKIKDPRVEVKTLHSLGYKFIRNAWSNVKPDDQVEVNRAFRIIGQDDKPRIAALCKTVGFVKNLFIKPEPQDIIDTIEARDILGETRITPAQLADMVMQHLDLSRERDSQGRISFDDMVWLPVALGFVTPCYDLVVIDECQDMNMPQLVMARSACRPTGRVIVVGDDRQAIYGFRGAAQDGMGMMRITLRAKTLPLTVTRRCPKAVVAHAVHIVPDYQAADDAPDGAVEHISESKMTDTAQVGDAILSRLNAPLMPAALSFLRRHIPARIEGRDIGKQLLTMVKNTRAHSIEEFLVKIKAWAEKQTERLSLGRNAEKKIEQVNDIADTLNALTEGCDTVAALESRIASLFQDTDENSRPAVVLSTVHKAKGLEWDRVFILDYTFQVKFRTSGNEEQNIRYVAITRAKSHLFIVSAKTDDKAQKQNELQLKNEPEKIDNSQPVNELENMSKIQQHVENSNTLKENDLQRAQPVLKMYADVLTGVECYGKTLAGQTICASDEWFRLGDVILLGGGEYGCTRVNQSRAMFRCLSREPRTVTTLSGETAEFQQGAKVQGITPAHSVIDNPVLRRMDLEEFKNFLTGKKSRITSQEPDNQSSDKKEETDMAKKTVKKTGKMAFISERLTTKPYMTKDALTALVIKTFPGSNDKTIRSTISWIMSSPRGLKAVGRTGHLLDDQSDKPAAKKTSKKAAAVKTAKPAKATKPAAKKTAKKAATPAVPTRPTPLPVPVHTEPENGTPAPAADTTSQAA